VDLAKDCARIIVLAPTTQAFRRSMGAPAQIAALPPDTRSLLISPDEGSRHAIGSNPLDPARRAPSARAGRRQGVEVAESVAAVWSS
jgi:NTE family protein